MKYKLSLVFVFLLSFLALLLLLSKWWLIKKFGGGISINQILFHLSFPLTGVDSKFISSYLKNVVGISLAISLVITFAPSIFYFLKDKVVPKILFFMKNHSLASRFCVCFGLLVAAFIVIEKNFKVIKHFKSKKEYSNFYEENYAIVDKDALTSSKNAMQKRNLIIIFVESLESTFSSKNIPTALVARKTTGGGGGISFKF